jgi:Animal haem peroxidase
VSTASFSNGVVSRLTFICSVTSGLYVNIILTDYVRTILNLNRTSSTWTLDPRKNFSEVFDAAGCPSGVGNQASVEFNLVYRWHSAISVRDEKWTNDLYDKLFPNVDLSRISMEQFIKGLRDWEKKLPQEPNQWEFGGMERDKSTGAFDDAELAKIIADSTEDVACAFGPRQVPEIMKLIEVLGMEQARLWNVATLNEFRKFFQLEPHKEFTDITRDPDVAKSLEVLYGHPDYVELYPGIVAEDAKIPLEPGSGLCPGYTISRAILADAVALTRGDRFYTVVC